MFYNTEHFAEAGIAGPPETQEEFAEVAAQLTDFANNRYGYYQLGGPAWSFQQWSTWMIGHGGIGVNNSMYEEDGTCILRREESIAGLEEWLAIYQEAQASPQASATGTFNDAANAFNAGQVSIVMGFLGYIQNFNNGIGSDKFAVAMPPSGPEGQFVHYGINGYSINAALDDSGREAAWELVQFMLTPEINAMLNEDWGAVPTVLESLEAEYLENPVFDIPKAMLQMDDAHVHTPRELPEWGDFFVNYGPEQIQSAMLGQSSAADFADAASTFLEEALQANT
jgi:ABC-type glycerol-3-phosphate transport system substrate-binding protein